MQYEVRVKIGCEEKRGGLKPDLQRAASNEVLDDRRAVGRIARELHDHLVAGNERIRIGDPALQCLRRPHDVRGGERSRVVEARLRARLAPDQAAMLRTGTVLIERMTRATAFLVQALAPRELIFSVRHGGEQQGREKKAGARSTPA